jgi:hypothetical protein
LRVQGVEERIELPSGSHVAYRWRAAPALLAAADRQLRICGSSGSGLGQWSSPFKVSPEPWDFIDWSTCSVIPCTTAHVMSVLMLSIITVSQYLEGLALNPLAMGIVLL